MHSTPLRCCRRSPVSTAAAAAGTMPACPCWHPSLPPLCVCAEQTICCDNAQPLHATATTQRDRMGKQSTGEGAGSRLERKQALQISGKCHWHRPRGRGTGDREVEQECRAASMPQRSVGSHHHLAAAQRAARGSAVGRHLGEAIGVAVGCGLGVAVGALAAILLLHGSRTTGVSMPQAPAAARLPRLRTPPPARAPPAHLLLLLGLPLRRRLRRNAAQRLQGLVLAPLNVLPGLRGGTPRQGG